jgi:hypothetical protein
MIETCKQIFGNYQQIVPDTLSKNAIKNAKKSGKQFYMSPLTKSLEAQMSVQYLCCYDSKYREGIVTRLVEYEDEKRMVLRIRELLREGKRVVIYDSNGNHATRMAEMCYTTIRTVDDKVPATNLFTKNTGTVDGIRFHMEKLKDSDAAIVTTVLGPGVSFNEENLYDEAFCFLQLSNATAPLPDMVQLCARVRSLKEKKLSYHLRCVPVNSQLEIYNRQKYLPSEITPRDMLHNCYRVSRGLRTAMICLPNLAKQCVREAFEVGFAHKPNEDTTHVPPIYKTNAEKHDAIEYRQLVRKVRELRKTTKGMNDMEIYFNEKGKPKALQRNDNVTGTTQCRKRKTEYNEYYISI